MSLPFTTAQFFDVFVRYNRGVWPAQILLTLLALIAIVLAMRKPGGGRFVWLILALLWAWMGVIYHLVYFSAINPAARGFAVLFLIAAAGFAWRGLERPDLPRAAVPKERIVVAYVLWLYALIGYPLAGYLLGHRYPALPTFGLPCPTTIFTIGAVLLVSPVPRRHLAIPILWSVIGTMAAIQLGVPQDFGLSVAGLAGIWACLQRQRRPG